MGPSIWTPYLISFPDLLWTKRSWNEITPYWTQYWGVFHLQKNSEFLLGILGISVWEESVPFVTSLIRLQAPLRRFTKTPDDLLNCSAFFSNTSLFVTFPSNKCLFSTCVVMRSLTSACSRRSRFTVVETSPVNERTFQSFSCNILHGKHAPAKKASNKQERGSRALVVALKFVCKKLSET